MGEDKFLDDKRVLFIGYVYYDYHIQIKKTLESAGAVVDYFPVMRYNIWYTLLRNLNTKLFLGYNKAYSRSIFNKIKNGTYEYVFVIQGFQLPDEFYIELRKLNPKARFLNYHWDSVRKTVYGNTLLDIIPFFDKAYSFDRKDCEACKDLHYLPLFYVREYEELRTNSSNVAQDIDLLFIGSICKYGRYQYVKEIEKFCSRQGIKFVYYLHVSRRYYLKNLFQGRKLTGVHFRPISHREIMELYKRSKTILDLPHQIQAGLPMRVFEALGAGKKLITANKNIAKEPFYDAENISIISSDNLSIDTDFVKNARTNWNSRLEKYSISSWAKNIFS